MYFSYHKTALELSQLILKHELLLKPSQKYFTHFQLQAVRLQSRDEVFTYHSDKRLLNNKNNKNIRQSAEMLCQKL